MIDSDSVVVLAAGAVKRFGDKKLLQDVCGMPLFSLTLRNVRTGPWQTFIVVSEASGLADRDTGVPKVINRDPSQGMSSSIRCAVEALSSSARIVFVNGDQPLVRAEHIERLIARCTPGRICATRVNGETVTPVCFPPKEFYGELRALRGDRGGQADPGQPPGGCCFHRR
ncbi:nucleotidyltransferase family protein [Thermogymnomonas acidicola]|uniref:nucleotidyltransferase family protein n=1 Tax=Thermogymnomonas acidicola TaxID=399579 RepID=UPI00094666D5|nr:nucleotidyltransferase family protein [Thermogymnomonas acidicola]